MERSGSGSRLNWPTSKVWLLLLHVYDGKWSDFGEKIENVEFMIRWWNCANRCVGFFCFVVHSLGNAEIYIVFRARIVYRFCCGHLKQSYTSQNRRKQDEAITSRACQNGQKNAGRRTNAKEIRSAHETCEKRKTKTWTLGYTITIFLVQHQIYVYFSYLSHSGQSIHLIRSRFFFAVPCKKKLAKIRNWFNLFSLQYCYFLPLFACSWSILSRQQNRNFIKNEFPWDGNLIHIEYWIETLLIE